MRYASLGTIREFNTPNFRVIVDATEDYDVDLSFDEDGSVRKDLESGRLISFCVRAQVFHKETGDLLASDYLGNCIYKSLEDFADHKECGKQNREYEARGESGRCGSYFSDMITTVCKKARQHVANRMRVYSNLRLRHI